MRENLADALDELDISYFRFATWKRSSSCSDDRDTHSAVERLSIRTKNDDESLEPEDGRSAFGHGV